jgi:uncharacterized membrane protein
MMSRVPKSRIESLTDLIFGLALSIGAVSLLSKPPSTPTEVLTDVTAFGFSFLILIQIWFRYTNIMSLLPVETSGTMFLNVVMLFLVSIEPYLLSLLTGSGSQQSLSIGVQVFASEIYALDLTGLTLILGLFSHQVTINERSLLEPEIVANYRNLRNVQYSAAALFAVSAIPIFWSWEILGSHARFILWYAVMIFMLATRLNRPRPR